MREQFREVSAYTTFTGTFPTVPTYEGIDIDALTLGELTRFSSRLRSPSVGV